MSINRTETMPTHVKIDSCWDSSLQVQFSPPSYTLISCGQRKALPISYYDLIDLHRNQQVPRFAHSPRIQMTGIENIWTCENWLWALLELNSICVKLLPISPGIKWWNTSVSTGQKNLVFSFERMVGMVIFFVIFEARASDYTDQKQHWWNLKITWLIRGSLIFQKSLKTFFLVYLGSPNTNPLAKLIYDSAFLRN